MTRISGNDKSNGRDEMTSFIYQSALNVRYANQETSDPEWKSILLYRLCDRILGRLVKVHKCNHPDFFEQFNLGAGI